MAGEGDIRAFLAFEIPASVKESLAVSRDRLRGELPPARWTRAEAWHLTLKFLGSVDRGLLGRVSGELRDVVNDMGSVSVRLGGAGFFPSPTRPRVAWIGGSSTGGDEVAGVVEEVFASYGFERERRRWSLHLTVARLKKRWSGKDVEHFLEWGERIESLHFVCPEFVLFQSALEPGGAVYTALERFPLE